MLALKWLPSCRTVHYKSIADMPKAYEALPWPFVNRLLSRYADEKQGHALLRAICKTPPVSSIRINPYVSPSYPTHSCRPIPWFPQLGYYPPKRPNYALEPLFYAGSVYPQDASSMLFQLGIPHLQDSQQLNKYKQSSGKPFKVLDLCAAPGGKSGVVASVLPPDSSVLVSNELVSNRTEVLIENMAKSRFPSTLVTQNASRDFLAAGLEEYFNLVIVDAPCSGEGLFRKEIGKTGMGGESVKNWSRQLTQQLIPIQKQLILDGLRLVQPTHFDIPGILVYMTCTFEPSENEEIVKHAWRVFTGNSHNHDDSINALEPLALPELDPSFNITRVQVDIQEYSQYKHHPVYYCYPNKVQGEGLFIALFKVNHSLSKPSPLPLSAKAKQVRYSKCHPSQHIQHVRSISDAEQEQCSDMIQLEPHVQHALLGSFSLPSRLFVSNTQYSTKAQYKQQEKKNEKQKSNKKPFVEKGDKLHVHMAPQSTSDTLIELARNPHLAIRKWGVHVGDFHESSHSNEFKRQFIPSPELALSIYSHPHSIYRLNLTHKEALEYVQLKPFIPSNPLNIDKWNMRKVSREGGWILVTFQDIPLGWMKAVGPVQGSEWPRLNCKYPWNWRSKRTLWEIES